MKRLVILVAVVPALAACGSSTGKAGKDPAGSTGENFFDMRVLARELKEDTARSPVYGWGTAYSATCTKTQALQATCDLRFSMGAKQGVVEETIGIAPDGSYYNSAIKNAEVKEINEGGGGESTTPTTPTTPSTTPSETQTQTEPEASRSGNSGNSGSEGLSQALCQREYKRWTEAEATAQREGKSPSEVPPPPAGCQA